MIEIESKKVPHSFRNRHLRNSGSVSFSTSTPTPPISGGVDMDVLKVDDVRLSSDNNVFSSLRTLAEILSRIIKSGDTITEPSDENTLSALRINAAIDTLRDESLSKAHPDETAFLLKALGGLIVNNGLDVIGGISTDTLTSATATTQILNVLNKLIGADADFSGNVQVDKKITTLNLLVKELADIYDLNVSHVATIMGTIVKEYVSSESFVSGFGGSGMKIYKALSGDWNLEIDNLTVRKVFSVFELMVQKITHQGGMVIRSAAGAKLTKVTDGGAYWKCEHDSTDDFVQGDQIICQSFTGTAIKRYWRLVTSSGAGYFNLSKTDCEQGSGTPEVGDEVAVLGNRTVSARQKAQIDCAVGDTAPYRDDYDNINSYSLVDKLITRTGNLSGITDAVFGVLSGSGLYGANVYLRGTFILKSGKKIEEAIADVENNLGARITATETELSAVPGRITAAISESKTYTDNSANAVRQETNAKIEVINGQISSKVSQDVFNELGRVVSQQGTEISQNKSDILLRASKEEVGALGNRLSTAEAQITPDAINLVVKRQTEQIAADASKRTDAWIEIMGLDENLYYPVTINLSTNVPIYTITVERTLNETLGKPSWSIHPGGFSVVCKWSVNAAGWGTADVKRTVLDYAYKHSNVIPVGSIGQMEHSSNEYFYVRCGSRYHLIIEGDAKAEIRIHTSAFSIDGQTIDVLASVVEPAVDLKALENRVGASETKIYQNAYELGFKVSASEVGDIADGKVNTIKGKLLDTGVDVENRKFTVTADTFRVQDNYGNPIAVFKTDATGKPVIKAENIDVDNLTVKKLDGATGSFSRLEAKGGKSCAIGFDNNEGKMYFEGDMQHQGFDYANNRVYRFLTADLWCRGEFGHRTMTSLLFNSSSTSDFYAHIYGTDNNADTSYHKYAQSGQPIDCIFLEGTGNYVIYVCDSPRRKFLTIVNNSAYPKRVITVYQNTGYVIMEPHRFMIFVTAETTNARPNPNSVVNLHALQLTQ